ncbi:MULTISPECIES: PAS domain S-box protein [Methanobacterium]|jgi:PAS domain S-box-containing protein|uniref:PAS domain S-box protein n=1 Tax=Methanobacterium veterum TaxID=408577 RepID=A0A9E4ZZH0_9EURY|nr:MULTISPECIES: PAS domain S-box protein [Methanobacterium]MCZ3365210.1 PAS domain S-box protein [Methanobacterium veterum]MCZ3372965.1 PAS domain S-box protein [Methanobacterium veterum]
MTSNNYSFTDLVDIDKIKELLTSFYELTGVISALEDLDGNVFESSDGFVAIGWQDICLNFHRKHPETLKKCIESGTRICDKLKAGEKQSSHICLNGLVDIAVPIYIEGEHLANLFTGQFFFKPPNMEFFRQQAHKYGFDEDEYLDALSKVDVFSEEFIEKAMSFLTNLASVIGEMGLEKKKLLDSKLILQESEERFRSLINNSSDLIRILDKEGRIIFDSPSSKRILGYFEGYFIGKNPLNFVHPDDLERVKMNLCEVYEKRNPEIPTEFRIRRADGEYIPVESVFQNLIDVPGIDGVVVTTHPVIERKRTENMLQFQANILTNVRDCVIVYDVQGRIIYWNKGAETIYGYLEEEIIGKNIEILYLNRNKRYFKPDLEGILEFGEYNGEWEGKRKDGSKVYVDVRETIMHDVNSKIIGVIGVSKDISERKKAEKRIKRSEAYYRTIFENTGTATIIIEEDTTISLVNAEFEKLYGYSKEEIESKKSWREFIAPDYKEKIEEYHNLRRIDPTLAPRNYELKFVDRQGRIKDVFTTVAIIPETKKSLISLLDITDNKIAENKIKESLMEKEVLLREIHHRVKNNLQIISSLLNLQTRCVEGEETINVLKESQNRVKTMAMVHEKLYQSEDLKDVNFKEYIENLVSDLFYSYGVKKGTIDLKIDADDIKMDIDTAIPCGLIINELVTNSLKYAFPGPNKEDIVKVGLKKLQQDKLRLFVSDNGVGLPENLDMENVETLGLKMVKILVNQLKGTLEVDRTNGTRFKIIFKELKYENRI